MWPHVPGVFSHIAVSAATHADVSVCPRKLNGFTAEWYIVISNVSLLVSLLWTETVEMFQQGL